MATPPLPLSVQVASATYSAGLGAKAPRGTHGGPTITVALTLPPAEGVTTQGAVKIDENRKVITVTVSATATFAPKLELTHEVARSKKELVLKVNRPQADKARYAVVVQDSGGAELFRTVFVNLVPKE